MEEEHAQFEVALGLRRGGSGQRAASCRTLVEPAVPSRLVPTRSGDELRREIDARRAQVMVPLRVERWLGL